jgi:hypothetical protein
VVDDDWVKQILKKFLGYYYPHEVSMQAVIGVCEEMILVVYDFAHGLADGCSLLTVLRVVHGGNHSMLVRFRKVVKTVL